MWNVTVLHIQYRKHWAHDRFSVAELCPEVIGSVLSHHQSAACEGSGNLAALFAFYCRTNVPEWKTLRWSTCGGFHIFLGTLGKISSVAAFFTEILSPKTSLLNKGTFFSPHFQLSSSCNVSLRNCVKSCHITLLLMMGELQVCFYSFFLPYSQ